MELVNFKLLVVVQTLLSKHIPGCLVMFATLSCSRLIVFSIDGTSGFVIACNTLQTPRNKLFFFLFFLTLAASTIYCSKLISLYYKYLKNLYNSVFNAGADKINIQVSVSRYRLTTSTKKNKIESSPALLNCDFSF